MSIKKELSKRVIVFICIFICVTTVILYLSLRENSAKYCERNGYELVTIKSGNKKAEYCVSDNKYCEKTNFYKGKCNFIEDKMCVPDSCCHASGCVFEEDAPDCEYSMCTFECRIGTMDCGAGFCANIEGGCAVIWNNEII